MKNYLLNVWPILTYLHGRREGNSNTRSDEGLTLERQLLDPLSVRWLIKPNFVYNTAPP